MGMLARGLVPSRGTGRGTRSLRDVVPVLAGAVLAASLTLAPNAAAATTPSSASVRVEAPLDVAGEITDPEGVLGEATQEVQDALDALAADTDLQLFVVYVPGFDGLDGIDWANATANASGLGVDDVLLAVATQDRRYGLSSDTNVGLSDADLGRVESVVEDHLRADDWAGAAVAAADTMRDAAGGGGVSGFLVLVVVGVLVLLVVLVVRAVVNRRRRAGTPGRGAGDGADAEQVPTEELDRRASAALVSVDDALRTSEQELGFAQAQFGVEATREFSTVLDDARRTVAEAFALRRRLDDAEPETEPEARAMLARVVELCDDVADRLDAQAKSFDALRDLQADAPRVLDETERRADEVAARVPAARAALGTLAHTYPATALASVAPNPEQAEALLADAVGAVSRGREALAAKDRAGAVAFARAAQNAVGQAVTLLDAVERAGTDLADAGARLERGLASIRADVADAARLAPQDASVVPALDEARAAADLAATVRDGGDPLAALRRLTDAEAALDAALAPFRQHAEQAARANALLRETVQRVDAQVRATHDYVETRRGAVGPEARTRLAEAVRLLGEARALQPSDPAGALHRAQEADAQAQSAARLAQQDAERWDASRGGTGGGSGGVGGMVLGGILLDSILRGGGGRSGGFGGGSFGGGFGGGGFGGGRPGGRSARSSGRRSSGGRAGRGGRF